ncbi:uncharacterized protein LOC110924044 [Helianthus annuus]|uniref:uncharacterized protein LOC110924044 n=1 Tax=Helianthus annuus TaxID=4232 RepID=UPI000B8F2058|nr:uncharacterized protein LOC110924044 [Helianthus annuus]
MFWINNWVGDGPLKDKFPGPFILELEKRCTVADCLNADSSGPHFNWNWSRNLMDGAEVNDLVGLCTLLLNTTLNSNEDNWEWIGNESKVFSVGDVKKLLITDGGSSDRYVLEGCKWIPAKVNIFIWRVEMGRIVTIDALKQWNIDIDDSLCSLCRDIEESVDHIFSQCYVASVIWDHISKWVKVSNLFFFSFRDILDIHNHVGLKGKEKEALKGIMRSSCWSLWRARNEARFNNQEIKIGEILSKIKAMGFLWFRNRFKGINVSWHDWCKFVIM